MDPQEIVVLVHGTFAATDSDEGEAWWQQNSKAAQFLEARLAPVATCFSPPFRWSGENLESARTRGSFSLGQLLVSLEARQIPYHLVGHSHGGSVVWRAIRQLDQKGHSLANLKTWTTVGTPFIHYAPLSPNLFLLLPAFVAIAGAIAVTALSRVWSVFTALAPLSILHGLSRTVLLIFSTLSGAAAGLTIMALLAIAIGGLVLPDLFLLYQTRRKANHTRFDSNSTACYRRFADRHCSIWCSGDEAIAGLRGALLVDHVLVPPMPLWQDRSFLRALLSPLILPVKIAYNVTVRRVINAYLMERLVDSIVGNDEHGRCAVAVSPAPPSSSTPAPMAPEVESHLQEGCDQHALATIRTFRSALGLLTAGSSWTALTTRLRRDARLHGMIHASYFDADLILDRICDHILGSSPPASNNRQDGPSLDATTRLPGRARRRLINATTGLLLTIGSVAPFLLAALLYQIVVAPLTLSAKIDVAVDDALARASAADADAVHKWVRSLCRYGRPQDALLVVHRSRGTPSGLPASLELLTWLARHPTDLPLSVQREVTASMLRDLGVDVELDPVEDDQAWAQPSPRPCNAADMIRLEEIVSHLRLRSATQLTGLERLVRSVAGRLPEALQSELLLVSGLPKSATQESAPATGVRSSSLSVEELIQRAERLAALGSPASSQTEELETLVRSLAFLRRPPITDDQREPLAANHPLARRMASGMAATIDELSRHPGLARAPYALRVRAARMMVAFGGPAARALVRKDLADLLRQADPDNAERLVAITCSLNDRKATNDLVVEFANIGATQRNLELLVRLAEATGTCEPLEEVDLAAFMEFRDDTFRAVAARILRLTADTPNAPLSWDEPLYRFLHLWNERGDLQQNAYQVSQIYHSSGPYSWAHHERFSLLNAVAAARCIRRGRWWAEDMIGSRLNLGAAFVMATRAVDQRAIDPILLSRLNGDMAGSLSASGEFHVALEAATSALGATERVTAYAEILDDLAVAMSERKAASPDDVDDHAHGTGWLTLEIQHQAARSKIH